MMGILQSKAGESSSVQTSHSKIFFKKNDNLVFFFFLLNDSKEKRILIS